MRAARLVPAILLLFAFFFWTQPLTAQSVYGGVWGRLTTPIGIPVSGASVSVTSVQTEARTRTRSDAGGYFTISNLAPDLYRIDVQADGFNRIHDTIPVSADVTTTVNVPLHSGDPNVIAPSTAASGSVLKLDRTDVSTRFDSLTIEDLPLLNLNVTELQLLVPGAARGQLFIPGNQNPQGGQPVNINGQHFSGSAFQVDGTENRDPLEGIVVINPTLDSVGEMKVTSQGYNAEFGQATAGVITIQTRSGSNSWHGDGFGFRRTGFGQSENPFDPAGVPPSKYSLFGGSFGGPIAKNKLFIFSDYQGTRSSQGANLLLSVPPDSVRRTCLGSAGAPGSMCDLSAYAPYISNPLSSTLVDPYHKDSKNNPKQFMCPKNGSMVPCNEIPNAPSSTVSGVTDQAVAILKLLPEPTPGYTTTNPACVSVSGEAVCDNYLASGQDVFSADLFDVRTDYIFNSNLRLFGRYSFGQFHENGAPAFGPNVGGLGTNPSGFAGVARTRNQGISSGFTYTLGAKLITDFRFGYFRYRLNLDAQGQTPDLGIPGVFAAETGNPFATKMPDFEIPGQQIGSAKGLLPGADYLRLGYSIQANSCSCPLQEREQQFQFVNNWTRGTGQHIIKWGVDLRFLQNYRFESDRPPTGYFSFGPTLTGLGLATFLIGDVTSFDRTISTQAATDAGEHQKRFSFYGQDTWRINSRLTLNYGLRWEIYFPQTVTGAGGFLVPNLSDHNPDDAVFNTPGVSNAAGGINGNLTNFAPRLGFAYLINSSTVVRAGYGRSFDAGYAGDLFGMAATENPPVTVVQNIQAVGFNLQYGPPAFNFPGSSRFSLLDLAEQNLGDPADANPIKRAGGSGAALYALPSSIRVPTVDSWNVTLQHELSSRLYFELAYVGNKGTHVFPDNPLGTYYLLNEPSLQTLIGQPNATFSNCKGGKNGIFSGTSGQFCLTMPQGRSFYQNVAIPNPPCPTTAPCAFNPGLFNIRYFGNNANDNYNSFQAKIRKNFSQGYSFLAHYTWSKGLDYSSNYFAVDPRVGYGPGSFDIRHRFVMTNIWDLPIGRSRAWLGNIGPAADRFVGGWTISAITILQSGLPFTPSYLNCSNDTDAGVNDPCQVNRVGPVQILGTREKYLSTTGGTALKGYACTTAGFCGVDANNGGMPVPGPAMGPWQRPGAGQIGNVGRDSFNGPGFFQSDIGLAKAVPILEGVALRFRADAFNAFNKVNLGQPNTCVDCSNGGVIGSLGLGAIQRRLQFSLRIEF